MFNPIIEAIHSYYRTQIAALEEEYQLELKTAERVNARWGNSSTSEPVVIENPQQVEYSIDVKASPAPKFSLRQHFQDRKGPIPIPHAIRAIILSNPDRTYTNAELAAIMRTEPKLVTSLLTPSSVNTALRSLEANQEIVRHGLQASATGANRRCVVWTAA